MERRLTVFARNTAQALSRRARCAGLLALAVVLVAGSADAKPRRRDARAAFDRGITAYQKGNFEAASEALGKSFALERDVDTLFAWAQSERKLEHCEQASDLYEKLLTFNLPAAHRNAVELKLDECRAVIAAQKPKGEATPAEPGPAEPVASEPRPQPVAEPPPRVAEKAPVPTEGAVVTVATPAPRAWYKDPVALGLGGAGVVATGVGVGLLISAMSLDSDSKAANDHDSALDLRNKARMRGNIGGATAAVGGAALIGAVVWVVLHRESREQHAVTGWLAPDGGGVAVAGGF